MNYFQLLELQLIDSQEKLEGQRKERTAEQFAAHINLMVQQAYEDQKRKLELYLKLSKDQAQQAVIQEHLRFLEQAKTVLSSVDGIKQYQQQLAGTAQINNQTITYITTHPDAGNAIDKAYKDYVEDLKTKKNYNNMSSSEKEQFDKKFTPEVIYKGDFEGYKQTDHYKQLSEEEKADLAKKNITHIEIKQIMFDTPEDAMKFYSDMCKQGHLKQLNASEPKPENKFENEQPDSSHSRILQGP